MKPVINCHECIKTIQENTQEHHMCVHSSTRYTGWNDDPDSFNHYQGWSDRNAYAPEYIYGNWNEKCSHETEMRISEISETENKPHPITADSYDMDCPYPPPDDDCMGSQTYSYHSPIDKSQLYSNTIHNVKNICSVDGSAELLARENDQPKSYFETEATLPVSIAVVLSGVNVFEKTGLIPTETTGADIATYACTAADADWAEVYVSNVRWLAEDRLDSVYYQSVDSDGWLYVKVSAGRGVRVGQELISYSDLPCGIANLASTCYAAATLQALAACSNFTEDLITYTQSAPVGRTTSAMAAVLHAILRNAPETVIYQWRYNHKVDPSGLFSSLLEHTQTFRSYFEQCDAHEFLGALLDALDAESVKNATHLSSPAQLFRGEFLTRTTCEECGRVTNVSEPFSSVSLDLPKEKSTVKIEESSEIGMNFFTKLPRRKRMSKKYTKVLPVPLESCMAGYIDSSNVESTCETCCKRTIASRVVSFTKEPEILVLHLKRFVPANKTCTVYRKDNCTVRVPADKFALPSDMADTTLKHYKLAAAVCHVGTVNCGHYRAVVRLQNNMFAQCNDTDVRELSIGSHFDSQEAYILYYVKINDTHDSATANLKIDGDNFDQHPRFLSEQYSHSDQSSEPEDRTGLYIV